MSDHHQLLRLLASGEFISGETLGRALGVTRAAVWKRLSALEALGIEVHSVRGRGYRLGHPVELLDAERIAAGAGPGGIEVHPEIDSTNAHLMRRAAGLVSGHACLAEHQHAGRGRRGRSWISPFGSNLYLSVLWRFDGAAQLGGLSLAVAVALTDAFEQAGAGGLSIKWPNDLVYEGRKAAGVLIEVAGEANGECHAVIGIGANLGMPSTAGRAVDQPWADLRETGLSLGRNDTAGIVLGALREGLFRFQQHGLEFFLDRWRGRDALVGKPVRVQFPDGELNGTAQGVDRQGRLVVAHAGGVQRLTSGEVSVRPA